jgi:two-component system, NarL family, nitrate/nitrite response regulator NarL
MDLAASQVSGMSIKIAVVCGIRIYRDGIAAQINRYDTMHVDNVFSDCGSIIDRLESLDPDLVIADIAVDGLIDLVDRIKRNNTATKLIVLTYSGGEDKVCECVRLGVEGFVSNNDGFEDLKNCINAVLGGEFRYPSGVARSLAKRMAGGTTDTGINNPLAVLTSRQSNVLQLMAKGLSNKEIARNLGIEVATVKNHVHDILDKLHVPSRLKAAAMLHGNEGFV